MPCVNTVHENACVQISIELTPSVTLGNATTHCDGEAFPGVCPLNAAESCTFTFHQGICVQIPVTIDTTAELESQLISCDTFGDGPCGGGGEG